MIGMIFFILMITFCCGLMKFCCFGVNNESESWFSKGTCIDIKNKKKAKKPAASNTEWIESENIRGEVFSFWPYAN